MAMRFVAALLCAAAIGLSAHAQTTLNPDFSAIGDFRAFSHNDSSRSDEVEDLNLASPEFEINVNGYLNPYVRADAVLGWHGEHNAEIEEVYATVERGLPLHMNLRVGKYLLEFGRLNSVHPHAYSFIERPLPHAEFFGEEGLADMAVRGSCLLPTGSAYTEIMVGLLKGDALAGHHHEHEGEESEEGESDEPARDLGFFGRLATSMAVSESSELAFGASALNAVYDVHEAEAEDGDPTQLRAWILGTDIKFKHRPNRYRALQIEAEGLLRLADPGEDHDRLRSYGAYGYIDYRFHQKYNIGGIGEWVRSKEIHEEEGEHHIHESDTWRAGLFVGFAPIEETSLVRLAGHWTEPEGADGFWEATMQLVISLGPHKAHNF